MTDFEKWLRVTPEHSMEAAWIAGQASAEHAGILVTQMKRINELEKELQEQCRLNGMGSEREARLMARVEELERERDQWKQAYEEKAKENGENIRKLHRLDELNLKAQAGESQTIWNAATVLTIAKQFECEGGYFFADHTDLMNFCERYAKATHPTAEPIKAQAGKPVAWCFRKSLVQKIQWAKPIGDDAVLRHWEPLYTHPTTERRVIPEDVRKVMEIALSALETQRNNIQQQDYVSPTHEQWRMQMKSASTALRKALNAAPAPTMETK